MKRLRLKKGKSFAHDHPVSNWLNSFSHVFYFTGACISNHAIILFNDIQNFGPVGDLIC